MKIKLLFGLMFVLAAFTMQAQFVGPNQAIQILENAAESFENGTYDVKDLYSGTNTGANSTNGPVSGDYNFDAPTMNNLFSGIMSMTAKEIMMVNDTAQGILDAESKLYAGADDNRTAALDVVFAYIKDIL